MTSYDATALARLLTSRTSHLLRRAARWWLAELLDLLPESVAERLIGPGRKQLVLGIDEESVSIELLGRGRRPLASERVRLSDYAPVHLKRFMDAHGIKSEDVDSGLRLGSDQIFRRKLLLPSEAAKSVDSIARQDLARRTPFKLADVYHGHTVATDDAGNRLVVRQWVARRKFVEELAERLQLDPISIVFVEAQADDEADVPFITVRSGHRGDKTWMRRSILALGYSAAGLAVLACALTYWSQQTAIDALDAQIATAKVKAQAVRAAVDKLEQKQGVLARIRSQRNSPGLTDILEEATRILPSHSWLTEFRLSETPGKRGRQVAMAGLSGAAPSLVAVIDASPLFAETSLTAPVTLDATEGRERFALQTKVRGTEQERERAP